MSKRAQDKCSILIVSDAWHPQVNGVVRTYEYLIKELNNLGHRTEVIAPCHFPVTFPMPFYSEIRLALFPYSKMARMIEEKSCDHIHIATEGPLGWAALRFCTKRRIPFTTSYHTNFPDYVANRLKWAGGKVQSIGKNLAKKFVFKFHKNASSVLVATKSIEDALKKDGFNVPIGRFSRGVNDEIFYYGASDVFDDLPKPIALYVGRVAVEKNLEDFLSMDWGGSKVVVGFGPSSAKLSKKYPNVHFLGKKHGKELADCYRGADVFVFPSKTDTFGIVLIEALACGLPVAAYRVMGPKDIITCSDFGTLSDDDLSFALMSALKSDMDPSDRSKAALRQYSWQAAAQQFLLALENAG